MNTTSATDAIEQRMPRSGFTAGLITGGIIGTVLALAFAPRAGADLRRSVTGAAKDLGAAAASATRTRAPASARRSDSSPTTRRPSVTMQPTRSRAARTAPRSLPPHSRAEAASALSSDPASAYVAPLSLRSLVPRDVPVEELPLMEAAAPLLMHALDGTGAGTRP